MSHLNREARQDYMRKYLVKHGDAGDLKSIYRTFGSWNEVIQILGLSPNIRGCKARQVIG